MTNKRNLKITLAVSAVTLVSLFLLSSWDFKQPITLMADDGQATDTIPKKAAGSGENREKKIRDLDDVLDELNSVDLKPEMEKMRSEIADAVKKIDSDKIRMEVEKAVREIDIEKIKQDVEASLAKIDWDKMKVDLEKVKDLDMKKLETDMKKMQKELSKIGPEIEKSMEKAKADIEKTKANMKEYNDFVNALENDGLLKRKEGYTIKHKDGELIINDKKVSADVYNKYRSFLVKHKKFSIDKSEDDFNINMDWFSE